MKLPKNGEEMNRRQLIQSMAFVTAACSAPLSRVFAMPRPQSEGVGFKAVAYNHISYDVPDYTKGREFYADLFGLKVGYDDGKQCSVEGSEPISRIYVRNLNRGNNPPPPGTKPYIDHFCFSIANYDSEAVLGELKRRNLDPKPDGKHSWTFKNPDGITMHITWDGDVYPGQTSPEGEFTGPVPPQPADEQKAPFRVAAMSTVIRTPDISSSRDFYMSLLGMKKIYEDNDQCFLAFGPSENNLVIRKIQQPDEKAHIESFGFTIADFKQSKVEAELKRRGLAPEAYSSYAFTVQDPDGTKFIIARKGLLEFLGKNCHGSASTCPAGKG